MGSDWRTAWLLFAALAAVATLWAVTVLAELGGAKGARIELRLSWFVCPHSGPLLAGAALVGLASSVYWTFGVDHLVSQGGLSTAHSRLFLVVVGIASVGGSLAGDGVRRLGGRATFVLAAVAEAVALALLGLAPASPAAVIASAGLFGVAYNTALAVQAIWSARVFADRPSAGLSVTMTMNALGLLAGPPILGALADRIGFPAVFTGAACLLLATAALAPRERLHPE